MSGFAEQYLLISPCPGPLKISPHSIRSLRDPKQGVDSRDHPGCGWFLEGPTTAEWRRPYQYQPQGGPPLARSGSSLVACSTLSFQSRVASLPPACPIWTASHFCATVVRRISGRRPIGARDSDPEGGGIRLSELLAGECCASALTRDRARDDFIDGLVRVAAWHRSRLARRCRQHTCLHVRVDRCSVAFAILVAGKLCDRAVHGHRWLGLAGNAASNLLHKERSLR